MRIGINCFKDSEFLSIIKNQNIKGVCEITGERDVLIYDTCIKDNEVLKEYIIEILSIYSPKSELPRDFPKESFKYIEEILFDDWSIFNTSKDNIKKIIVEMSKETYSSDSPIFTEKVGLEKLCDVNFLRKNSLLGESSWEKFVSSIKGINRYHSNHINLKMLGEFFYSPQMKKTISHEIGGLYRARIADEDGMTKEQMGPPPSKYATAGRANSAGISCLYLANDIVTTFHEIRARDLDYISVAKFVPNKKVEIVNLSELDKISPFLQESFDYEWFAINMPILKKISSEIAKPLRRQDSEIDYLPAQYISDFVKSLGFDGLSYCSTLNKGGINYAFFNYKKFKCVDVKLYHISALEFETTPRITTIEEMNIMESII